MNTVKKGDEFEDKALQLIEKLIEDGQIGHLRDCLRIKRKAKFYSPQRESEITFDMVIEFWPPGADRYSLIYVIECKNYEERVSVNKVETFHSQLTQVFNTSGFNVKGIFITHSMPQSGGVSLAKNLGLMLIQGELEGDYKIIFHRRERVDIPSEIPSWKKDKELDSGMLLVEKILDKSILGALKNAPKEGYVSYGIDRLSKKDIELRVEGILDLIDPNILKGISSITPLSLRQSLMGVFGITVSEFKGDASVLGFCNIENKEIGIHSSIQGTKRELFLLAHELGHFVLHQNLSIGQTAYDSFDDSKANFEVKKYELINPRHWIEWQANYFAGSLIFPKRLIQSKYLAQAQHSCGFGYRNLYLDDTQPSRRDFWKVIYAMANRSFTTPTTAIYRLEEFDLITYNSSIKPMSELIHNYFLTTFPDRYDGYFI